MKFINITKHLIVNFRIKHKLSFKNIHNSEEVWSVFISPANVLLVFFTFLLLMFVAVMLIVTYSPILDMIPGYPGNKSREVLLQNVVKLDSLEREIKKWEIYESNIAAIMNGRTPVSVTASQSVDTTEKKSGGIVTKNEKDSLFRLSIENDDNAKQRAQEERSRRSLRSFGLFTPLQGVVAKPFNLESGSFGIEVSPTLNQDVLAVNDGVVILSTWDPESGYIMQIQHGGNMVSTYKRMSRQIKGVGERVRAGEVIGYIGGEESANRENKPVLEFELWDSGVAVDPLNYILF